MTVGRPSSLDTARHHLAAGHHVAARHSIVAAIGEVDDLSTWLAADRLLAQLGDKGARRSVKVGVLSSHTSGQLTAALRAAAAVHGLSLTTYESNYRTFEQEALDASSGLFAFAPDLVLIAADQREVHLPEISLQPEDDLRSELDRWERLWDSISTYSSALVLQLSFVPPLTDALGSFGAQHPGGRRRLIRRLNLGLGERMKSGVHIVDLEAVSYDTGRSSFADARYWYRSKHAIGLAATTAVARASADTMAAALGVSRKLVVLDLDNTIWGGVVGEDGLSGLELGDGPRGEAYVDFQRYLKSLRQRGLLLAVSSKNNEADALAAFGHHPDMVLEGDDLVAFVASWEPKPAMVEKLAAQLGLGLDSIVFVDDNPAERAAMRHALPQVGVVELPAQPSGYVDAIARFPGLQTTSLTEEDLRRTTQYRARSLADALEKSTGSRQEYLAELGMSASIEPLSDLNVDRICQLIGKTNQFNLTGRRHTVGRVRELGSQSRSLVWGMRLRDRFDDHGLIAVLICEPLPQDPHTLVIDTFVMSCRVLARTVEQALLAEAADWAGIHGYHAMTGHFVPSGRNAPARTVLPDAGYRPAQLTVPDDLVSNEDVQSWRLDLQEDAPVRTAYVAVQRLAQEEMR